MQPDHVFYVHLCLCILQDSYALVDAVLAWLQKHWQQWQQQQQSSEPVQELDDTHLQFQHSTPQPAQLQQQDGQQHSSSAADVSHACLPSL